jgi:hypothetical protein
LKERKKKKERKEKCINKGKGTVMFLIVENQMNKYSRRKSFIFISK